MIYILLCVAVLGSSPMTLEKVVAVVGAEPVLHSDVVSLLIESGIDQNTAYASDPSSPAYQLALDQNIENKLLVEAARREGLYPGNQEIEDVVDATLDEIREGFYSEQEFLNYLASAGMTLASIRESYFVMMGDEIASENYVRMEAAAAMAAMPSDAKTFFIENPEIVEEVLVPTSLSWIYLPVLPGETEEEEVLLAEVRNLIETGETTFSAAAAAYSQDGTAAMGGDLGWFGRQDMTAVFEGVVYSLEPGEIAGPFLTPFGVHLVKLTDRNEEQVRASHIIFIEELTPEDLDRTMQQAEDLVTDLEAGLNFVDAVNSFSFDPDPDNTGGYLGTVTVGAWEGEMREAVRNLSPGQVSSPVAVEQNMAVVIFRVNEDLVVNWEEFSTEELQSMLQSVHWQNYYSDMIESLRADIPVMVNF